MPPCAEEKLENDVVELILIENSCYLWIKETDVTLIRCVHPERNLKM